VWVHAPAAVGHPGDDLAAIAVAHQHDVVQFLGICQRQHVGDMGLQADLRLAQVGAVAVAGQRGGVHLEAGLAQRASTRRQIQAPPQAPCTRTMVGSGSGMVGTCVGSMTKKRTLSPATCKPGQAWAGH
jgi:hypothetical protein